MNKAQDHIPLQSSEISKRAVAEPIQAPSAESIAEPLPQRIDLRQAFPISWRLVIANSLLHILLLGISVAAYSLIILRDPIESGATNNSYRLFSNWIYYSVVLVCGSKIFAELIGFLSWKYSIELEHISIAHGLLFRSRSSFPIAKINDVSIHRSPIEILLGLHTLTILTASPSAVDGSIHGLPSSSAYGLQAYLLALLETTLPDLKEHVAEDVLAHRHPTAGHEENRAVIS